MKKSIGIGIAAILVSFPALAAEPRYTLERTEGGIVRLDSETGAMTLCREESGNLTCRMAANERAAYEKELDLLEKRVTVLEERFSHMPPGALPDDRQVERSLSLMERLMRSFMGIVREFTEEPEKREPQPDHT